MPKMLVLCPFPEGVAAGQRLKYEQYFDDWRANGWDITVSPFMDMTMWNIVHKPGHTTSKIAGTWRGHFRRLRDLARLREFDLVYVFMYVTPFGTTWMERLTRRLARRIVYDIEDNLLTEDGAPRGFRQWLKGRNKPRFLLERADSVLTASPFMMDRYRMLNQRGAVTLIYPSVDTETFRPRAGVLSKGKPVIGWTGTFSSKPYLDLLRPIFQELARRVDYKLIVIGNFPYALPGVDLEVLTWSREEEVAQMQRLDIGVYPLPEDDWVLGKAGLKVIQYMAFGLPSVSSNIGTATQQVENGVNGFLVDTEEEWLARLEQLCRDPELRFRIGEAARHEAVARYSRQATSAQYLKVLHAIHKRDQA
jgi:glycosyltransferase involved in cell wall biosynthesis